MSDVPSAWRKSSHSGKETACVEVGCAVDGAAVRDSKDRAAGYFVASHPQWDAFVEALKADRFTT